MNINPFQEVNAELLIPTDGTMFIQSNCAVLCNAEGVFSSGT
jgi:hypothetical protein